MLILSFTSLNGHGGLIFSTEPPKLNECVNSIWISVPLLNWNMDGQLGRQRAASYPALITFPRSSSFSFDESQANSTSWNEDCRDSDGSNPKVLTPCLLFCLLGIGSVSQPISQLSFQAVNYAPQEVMTFCRLW